MESNGEAGTVAGLAGITLAAGVRERVRRELDAPGAKLSQATVAREANMSKSTLSLYLSDTYAGNVGAVEEKLARWLSTRAERGAVRAMLRDAPAFVETETAAELMNAFRRAQALADLTAVTGVPGVGKTTTARHYRDAYMSVWVVTLGAYTTGVVPVLRAIAAAVGAEGGSGASGLALAIIARLQGTRGLLIVDEAHHATPQALDAIRGIYDEAGVGVALVGGPELAAKVNGMAQLGSRLGHRVSRARVSVGDVAALLDAWQVDGDAERALLGKLASRPGCLRSVTKALQLANLTASGDGTEVTFDHIRDAVATLSVGGDAD